ncbi:hypothetical protein CEB3_c43820 [Peptococcaceae bacterium CEB3]|nr:hypothetical protein CEB3_c43820 [Peptococcaceae bacterium CEB3]
MWRDAKGCGAEDVLNRQELLELLTREVADRAAEMGVEDSDDWYIEHLARKIIDLVNTTQ